MTASAPRPHITPPAEIVPPDPEPTAAVVAALSPTSTGQAALAPAQALAKRAAAPATLRAYKADWTHYANWCTAHGFIPVPAAPMTVGAYLASLAGSHAPTTIRRRLSAPGKMHRFNDLPWNPAHRDIALAWRGSRWMGSTDSARMRCASASSPKPTIREAATKTSCATPAIVMFERCAGTSSGLVSCAKAPPPNSDL